MHRFAHCFVASFMLLLVLGQAQAATSPDQTVLTVAKGLADNKPVVIWEALPASYQKDVHDVLHGAMAKIDPELYDQSMGMVQRIAKILKDKKQFILAHPMMASMPNKAEVEKQWDPMVGMFDTILASDFGTHAKAKSINLGAFLDKTGAKVMADVTKTAKLAGDDDVTNEFVKEIEKLKTMKASVVKQEGDKATVKIEATGQEAEEVEFTLVEGKWLPTELVAGWSDMIAQAKAEIANMNDEDMKKAKQMAIPMFGMFGGILGTLENAKTQEEFNTAVNGIMQMMGAGVPDQE